MEEGNAMKWVTRENTRIDRVSCSWLILGFADPDAEILYVPTDQVMAVAERENAIPFDVPNVEMGHHDDKCSFDAILEKYGPKDPALERVAKIVRGADTPNKDLTPESRGLDALANGFKRMMQAGGYDDRESIRRQWRMYNAFYLFCGGDPAKAPEPK
jgi:hypothetical protein